MNEYIWSAYVVFFWVEFNYPLNKYTDKKDFFQHHHEFLNSNYKNSFFEWIVEEKIKEKE